MCFLGRAFEDFVRRAVRRADCRRIMLSKDGHRQRHSPSIGMWVTGIGGNDVLQRYGRRSLRNFVELRCRAITWETVNA